MSDSGGRAILGAMLGVDCARRGELSDIGRRTIDSAGQVLLGRDDLAANSLKDFSPPELALAVETEEEAQLAVSLLAVMSLVGDALDRVKTERVLVFAEALEVDADYLEILDQATNGDISDATKRLMRKNLESFPRLNEDGIETDPAIPLLPYRDDGEQPDLEARFRALADLEPGTLGYGFFSFIESNGLAFPGHPDGLADGFTVPHDSSHVVAGYSASEQGELCTATFIGAMHPVDPMEAEVLPVLFSWHLDIKLDPWAESSRGAFDPRKFWTAWERGRSMKVDLLDEEWDFWGATEVPLDELRREYGVLPVEDNLLA